MGAGRVITSLSDEAAGSSGAAPAAFYAPAGPRVPAAQATSFRINWNGGRTSPAARIRSGPSPLLHRQRPVPVPRYSGRTPAALAALRGIPPRFFPRSGSIYRAPHCKNCPSAGNPAGNTPWNPGCRLSWKPQNRLGRGLRRKGRAPGRMQHKLGKGRELWLKKPGALPRQGSRAKGGPAR